jgi:hypothetical protein
VLIARNNVAVVYQTGPDSDPRSFSPMFGRSRISGEQYFKSQVSTSRVEDKTWKKNTYVREGLFESRLSDIPGMAAGGEGAFLRLGGRDRAGGYFV